MRRRDLAVMMFSTLALAGLALGGCRGSDPAEMARERGAVELLTSWPCGATHFINLAGGDLKTDWTAQRIDDGAYRVARRKDGATDTWTVRVNDRAVTPDSEGARLSWIKCRESASVAPVPPAPAPAH